MTDLPDIRQPFTKSDDEVIRTHTVKDASWKLMRPKSDIRSRREQLIRKGVDVVKFGTTVQKYNGTPGLIMTMRNEGKTLAEIGQSLGISRQRVHQILQKCETVPLKPDAMQRLLTVMNICNDPRGLAILKSAREYLYYSGHGRLDMYTPLGYSKGVGQ
jgi:hypothetical protein